MLSSESHGEANKPGLPSKHVAKSEKRSSLDEVSPPQTTRPTAGSDSLGSSSHHSSTQRRHLSLNGSSHHGQNQRRRDSLGGSSHRKPVPLITLRDPLGGSLHRNDPRHCVGLNQEKRSTHDDPLGGSSHRQRSLRSSYLSAKVSDPLGGSSHQKPQRNSPSNPLGGSSQHQRSPHPRRSSCKRPSKTKTLHPKIASECLRCWSQVQVIPRYEEVVGESVVMCMMEKDTRTIKQLGIQSFCGEEYKKIVREYASSIESLMKLLGPDVVDGEIISLGRSLLKLGIAQDFLHVFAVGVCSGMSKVVTVHLGAPNSNETERVFRAAMEFVISKFIQHAAAILPVKEHQPVAVSESNTFDDGNRLVDDMKQIESTLNVSISTLNHMTCRY